MWCQIDLSRREKHYRRVHESLNSECGTPVPLPVSGECSVCATNLPLSRISVTALLVDAGEWHLPANSSSLYYGKVHVAELWLLDPRLNPPLLGASLGASSGQNQSPWN